MNISELNQEAKNYLLLASESGDGKIYKIFETVGYVIQIRGKDVSSAGGREEAAAEAALNQLLSEGLISQQSEQVYKLTDRGYNLADQA